MHYKKNGTLDMRYASSRAAVSGGSSSRPSSSGSSYTSSPSYSSSSSSQLHYKKDGTLDMRYSSSRAAAPAAMPTSVYSSPSSSLTADLHYKKDGALDMRYNSSRAAVASTASHALPSSAPTTDLHYKKDGTLDMRYTSSRTAVATGLSPSPQQNQSSSSSSTSDLHYKKDGNLDMRYSSSRTAAASAAAAGVSPPQISSNPPIPPHHGSSTSSLTKRVAGMKVGFRIPSDIPCCKDGRPDMRFKAAKEWVRSQAASCNGIDVPDWVPTKKDGTVDMSYTSAQEFITEVKSSVVATTNRSNYYRNRKRDRDFAEQLALQRSSTVEYAPEYSDYYPSPQWPEEVEDTMDLPSLSAAEFSRPTQTRSRNVRLTMPMQNSSAISLEISSSATSNAAPTVASSSSKTTTSTTKSTTTEPTSTCNLQALEIPSTDLKLDEGATELGRGAFGIVRKALWREQQVAVKTLHCAKLSKRERADFFAELEAMIRIGNHPNVIQLYGYCLEPLALVMELAKYDSLSHVLHYSTDPFIEANMTDGRIKKKIAVGVANALAKLHSSRLIHGDIKPQNVLLMDGFVPKLTDFGLATLRGKTSSSLNVLDIEAEGQAENKGGGGGGTAAYMAPELLEATAVASDATDVYSFGILVNELVQEEEPYYAQYKLFLGKGPYAAANFASTGRRPAIADDTPADLKAIIERCWHVDASQRPKSDTLITMLLEVTFPDSFGLSAAIAKDAST